MSYTVTFADGTTAVRARKDAALTFAEKSGQAYTVISKSGAVVAHGPVTETPAKAIHADVTVDALLGNNHPGTKKTPAEAPAPEDSTTTEENPVTEKTEAAKPGQTVVYHQPRKRSKFFFGPMSEAGVRLATQQGLTAEVDKEALGVKVIGGGGKRAFAKFDKDVNLMWDTAYEDFKGYKKENKVLRSEQMKSRDTLKVMCDAEHAWFAQRLDAYLEDQDVL